MSETFSWLWRDVRRARRQGPQALAERQRRRLGEAVAWARSRSPYYGEHYRGLPDLVTDPTLLPVTDKQQLMARFDDWVCDRDVTLELVRDFVGRPDLVGARLLDRYLVATTSGTTGSPGLFVADDRSVTVGMVIALQLRLSWLGPRDLARVVAAGGRIAAVVATGGHYMAAAGATRLGPATRISRVFPAQLPLPELVEALNRFRPAILIGYSSMMSLLAAEQRAGRLHIAPVLVEPAGETLAEGAAERIAEAFSAMVRAPYGSTECTFLSGGCAHGWYHVNTDWAVLEPVDADLRPVPPGTASHSVLLSNLANRVQPVLRYNLGDSVTMRPDPCPCGSPLPALRVRGRCSDVVTVPALAGGQVVLAPLLFATVLDRTPGIAQFQLVQTAPEVLWLRLRPAPDADPGTVWDAALRALAALLVDHGAAARVERAPEPPQQGPGGKFRSVVPAASGPVRALPRVAP